MDNEGITLVTPSKPSVHIYSQDEETIGYMDAYLTHEQLVDGYL